MKNLRILSMTLLALFALMVSGCGGGPSAGDLRNLLAKDSPDFLRVKEVNILNMVKQNDAYLVYYETTLEFTKSFSEVVKGMDSNKSQGLFGSMMGAVVATTMRMQYGEWQAGDVVTSQGQGLFAKGAKGWVQLE